jgi:hypothetical protein
MKLDECNLWFKNEYIDSTMIRNLQGIDMIGRNYQDKFKFGTKVITNNRYTCSQVVAGIAIVNGMFRSNMKLSSTIYVIL